MTQTQPAASTEVLTETGHKLTVISTLSVREALIELVPKFEEDTGYTVEISYGGGSVLSRQLFSGTEADLFIGPEEFSEQLASRGVLMQSGRTYFARSSTGMAVSVDAPKPDISSGEKVVSLLLAARSVCYSAGVSGIHFEKFLGQYGIADAVAAKRVTPGTGELVGDVVARRAAEVGIQQVSELLPVHGIHVLGLPPEFQHALMYGGTEFSKTKQSGLAQAFLRFLCSDAALAVLRTKGLQPICA